jgi:acyl-homoserine lactone acylase PvdQ
MHELLDGRGKASLSDVVNVMRQGATRDARGVYLGPAMLRKAAKKKAGQPAEYASALTIVSDWVAGGAHRKNAERGDTMDEGAALAIFDRWYDKLAHAVFDDEIGADGYPLFPDAPITNYNPRNGGGFFFDFSTYLRNLFNRRTRLATYKRNYCNNISTEEKETCVGLIAATLVAALAELKEEQGDDPAAWTTPAENISFTNNSNSTSAGSVGDIPWQNRGTENHIVEVLGKAE